MNMTRILVFPHWVLVALFSRLMSLRVPPLAAVEAQFENRDSLTVFGALIAWLCILMRVAVLIYPPLKEPWQIYFLF